MEGFTDKQNEVFGKLFVELKKRKPSFKSDAIAMLKMDDENFTKLFTDIDNEIIGYEEDIDLCHQRAKHLGITNDK